MATIVRLEHDIAAAGDRVHVGLVASGGSVLRGRDVARSPASRWRAWFRLVPSSRRGLCSHPNGKKQRTDHRQPLLQSLLNGDWVARIGLLWHHLNLQRMRVCRPDCRSRSCGCSDGCSECDGGWGYCGRSERVGDPGRGRWYSRGYRGHGSSWMRRFIIRHATTVEYGRRCRRGGRFGLCSGVGTTVNEAAVPVTASALVPAACGSAALPQPTRDMATNSHRVMFVALIHSSRVMSRILYIYAVA
jgi:hypothetical protein